MSVNKESCHGGVFEAGTWPCLIRRRIPEEQNKKEAPTTSHSLGIREFGRGASEDPETERPGLNEENTLT